jgi:predicted methyltransferase
MNRTLYHRYRSLAFSGGLALVLAASCSKSKSDEKVEATKVETKAKAPDEKPVVDPKVAEAEAAAAAKKIEDTKKVAEAIKELEAELATERERWTEAVVTAVKTLAATDHANAKDALTALLASPHRKPEHVARDAHRHPLETLQFFGVALDTHVVEMGVGRGWYTEILAPLVAKNGHFVGGAYDPEGPLDSMRTVYAMRQKAFFGNSEELYGKAKTFDLGAEELVIGEADSADVVLAIREMHNWQRRDSLDAKLKAIVSVLKPGGTFGVVQHRAKADAKAEESAELGYLPEAWVIAKVEAAGLKLVEKSEINANEEDTKDYEDGVWTLPPSLSKDDTDRAKYEAIGESDRMTLRFEKPKAE